MTDRHTHKSYPTYDNKVRLQQANLRIGLIVILTNGKWNSAAAEGHYPIGGYKVFLFYLTPEKSDIDYRTNCEYRPKDASYSVFFFSIGSLIRITPFLLFTAGQYLHKWTPRHMPLCANNKYYQCS